MKIPLPNAASVALLVALITVVTTFIETTYPGTMYVWAPLVVGVLTVLAKWMQEYLIDKREDAKPTMPVSPDGAPVMMAAQPPVAKPSMLRRVLVG